MVVASEAQRLKGRSYLETRSAVLDLIRSSDGISRVELARRSGLAEATISKIVKDLLAGGVIMSAGEAKSTGGKRATLLRLNDSDRYAVGVTLDVSTIVVALCGLDGAAFAELNIPGFGSETPRTAIRRVATALERLLADRGLDKQSLIGVGLASSGRRGGPLGWGEDAVLAGSWELFDAGEALSAHLGLPVTVENDANCAALGIFWSGGASVGRTFVTIYMSEGVGAGIVINGSLFRGASGNAGEIGHIIVEPDGLPCWCGSRGCLETIAAPRSLVQRVLTDPSLRECLDIDESAEPAQMHQRLLAAAERGAAPALALLTTSARSIADVILGLVNTLDLDSVYLAGPGFGTAAPVYLAQIRLLLAEASLARGVHPISVEFAGGGPEVAALGAASVVLHSSLTPHHNLSTAW